MTVSTGTTTTGAILTVAGNLSVAGSAVLTMGNFAFTTTGTSSITGTVNTATGATGTRTFTNNVTINSGGVWNLTGQCPATSFASDITMNGTTFDNGCGATAFIANVHLAGSSDMSFVAQGGTATISNTFTLTNNNTGTVTFGIVNGGGSSANFVTGLNSTTNFVSTVMTTGTLSPGASANTINFTANAATVTARTYYNLGLMPPATSPQVLGAGTFTINNNLTVGDGINAGATAATNNPAITIGGTLTVAAGATFVVGSGTLTLTGTGTPIVVNGSLDTSGSTINYSSSTSTSIVGATYNNLALGTTSDSGAGATYTLTGNVAVTQTLTVGNSGSTNSDTLDLSTYILDLSGIGSPLNLTSKGTLTPSLGTVRFSGNGATTIPALTYFNLQVFPGGSSVTHTLGAGTFNVNGDLDIGGNANAASTVITAATNNPTINVGGNLTVCAGSCAAGLTYTKGTTAITLNANSNAVLLTDNSPGLQDLGALTLGDGSVSKIVTLNSPIKASSVTVAANATLSLGNSTLTLLNNATPLTVSGSFSGGSGTVALASANTTGTTVPALTYNNLTLNKAGNTFTAATGTLTVNGNLNVTAGTFDLNTNDPATTVAGSVTIDGTVLASNTSTLTFGTNWTNNGTFTHNNGTVADSAPGSSAIAGTNPTTFYNFNAANLADASLLFKAGSTTTVANTLTLTGTNDHLLLLRSTTDGTQWTLNFTGPSSSLNNVDFKDGHCTGNALTLGTTVVNEGNNTGCVDNIPLKDGSGGGGPPAIPNWQPNNPYVVGNQVNYGGVIYTCLQDHTSALGLEPSSQPTLWQQAGGGGGGSAFLDSNFRYASLHIAASGMSISDLAPTEPPLVAEPLYTIIPATTVSTSEPVCGSTNVPIDESFSALFTKSMKSRTVNSKTVKLFGPDNISVRGNVSYLNNSNSVIFNPNRRLTANSLYTMMITNGIKDRQGVPLIRNFVCNFTTGTTANSSNYNSSIDDTTDNSDDIANDSFIVNDNSSIDETIDEN